MQLQCPQCKHTLVFEGERPRFCSQCGQPLSTSPDVSVDSPTITSIPEPVGSTVTKITSTAGVGREFVEGDVVGGYRLIRRLGAGAMGCVFEAEHRNTSRRVAIKLIAPDIALSPTAVERFRVEGRLASLIAHPRCVFVLEADEIDGQPFIVMELMPGATLSPGSALMRTTTQLRGAANVRSSRARRAPCSAASASRSAARAI